jgi:hypothetical protein
MSSAQKPKTLSDIVGYASGLVALIACFAFVVLMFRTGLTKTAMKTLVVCFVASVLNYALSSSGYNITPSSLSMHKIN